jgi:hypothetical protein
MRLWYVWILVWHGSLYGQAGIDLILDQSVEHCNQLELKVRSAEALSGNYSAGIFTIRYPESLGGVLTVAHSVFGYQVSAQGSGNDGYRYVALSFAQTNFISWQGGSAYTAALLTFDAGPVGAHFELVSGVPWTNHHNGNYYQELGGQERQGVLENRIQDTHGGLHQVQLACQGQINMTLGGDCSKELFADQVLTGEWRCLTNDYFEIQVMDSNPGNGAIIDGPGLYVYVVGLRQDLPFSVTFSMCWGLVLAEDKQLPACLAPPDTSLRCYEFPMIADSPDPVQLNEVAGVALAVDNCPGVFIAEDMEVSWSPCGDGHIQRIFRAVDAEGNMSLSTCRQSVVLLSEPNHDIRFPGDIRIWHGEAIADTLSFRSGLCGGLTVSIRDDTLWNLSLCSFVIQRNFRVIAECSTGYIQEISRDENCDGEEGVEDVWVIVRGDSMYIDVDDDYGNAIPMAGERGLACDGQSNVMGYWRSGLSAGIRGWAYRQNIEVLGLCCDQAEGLVVTETGLGVPGVMISGGSMTDDSGGYVIGWSGGVVAQHIRPYKNNLPGLGVSVMDIVWIQRHILGVMSLSSPYSTIAADVNRSGTITILDIIHIQRLILGVVDGFPGNTSWRFIPQAYVFPNAGNPWQEEFPEFIDWVCDQGNQQEGHFVAIKVGDVNGSAVPEY